MSLAIAAALVGTSAIAAVTSFLATDVALQPTTLAQAVREDRISFARQSGCVDPEGTVAAVEQSPLADLLLSTAIEESGCTSDAIGKAGEQGAWQVIEKYWGPVPVNDLTAQAKQAERVIVVWSLANDARGDYLMAMARYNGGVTPPRESFWYAKRVIQRQQELTRYLLEKAEERAGT